MIFVVLIPLDALFTFLTLLFKMEEKFQNGTLVHGNIFVGFSNHHSSSVPTNGTIRVKRRTKSERINIRRVTPYFEN
jgi:hypothetical protein